VVHGQSTPMRTPRSRRVLRRVCLDIAHRHPDMPCPYCDHDSTVDPLIAAAQRRHAQTVAEDADGFGWSA
jgi:hypothetical protein